MKKIITKAIIYSILSATCFASENIEPDIEMGISTVMTPSLQDQLTLEDEKLEKQIPQRLPVVIPDDENKNIDTNENNQNTNSIQRTAARELFTLLKYIWQLMPQYGIQTASGLTVLGIWYKYFS